MRRWLVPALLMLSSPMAAQSVELRLREDPGSSPIAGAIVRLLGPGGVVAQGLSNESGLLTLHAPGPGSYRIRIDRIGWTGLTTDPVELADGQTLRILVPMASKRSELPELTVESKSKCDRGNQGGTLAAALWDEIRKALAANVLTNRARAIPLHLRQFVRDVSLDRQPIREWVVVSRLVRGAPFVSLPPDTLAARGFMSEADEVTEFAAPDAALLLSDQFVATHCFRAVPGALGQSGLAFQPAPGRTMPEVTGTIWVDRASSELRYLDYAYTGMRGILRRAALGGRVEFNRLPNGAWIVNYWYIRMPRIEVDTMYRSRKAIPVARLAGYVEQGGRAQVATDTLGRIDRAILRGRVYDSTRHEGLARAIVWVRGTGDSISTDSTGRFEMAVRASGDQVVLVRHPRLVLTGGPQSKGALLSLADTTMIGFAIPSPATLARSLCASPPARARIVGLATRADGNPAVRFQVRSGIWSSEVDPRGLFAFCDLPPDLPMSLRLEKDGMAQAEASETPLRTGETRWLDLREWGSPDSQRVAAATVRRLVEHGPDVSEADMKTLVRGTVVDSTTGEGIAGAVVRVVGAPDSAVTDSAGRYLLGTARSGHRVVTVGLPGRESLRGVTSQAALLSVDDTASVNFAVISVSAVAARLCGAPRGRSGLVGIAFSGEGRPEAGVSLRAEWLTTNGSHTEMSRSGPGGLYAFCDLPPDLRITVSSRGLSGGGEVQLTRNEYRWQELRP